MLEKDTGISKGYAFCAYYDIANAESAVRNLGNREINGRSMRLGYAQDYAFRFEESAKGGPPRPDACNIYLWGRLNRDTKKCRARTSTRLVPKQISNKQQENNHVAS